VRVPGGIRDVDLIQSHKTRCRARKIDSCLDPVNRHGGSRCRLVSDRRRTGDQRRGERTEPSSKEHHHFIGSRGVLDVIGVTPS